jgi:hypothetical protein
MLNIHSIKLGPSNNSSSSHSIAFGVTGIADQDVPDGAYGWEEFVLASHGAKLGYIAQQFRRAMLKAGFDTEMSRIVINELLSTHYTEEWLDDGYVDHESDLGIPLGQQGRGFNTALLKAIRDLLLRPDAVIYGGNNNDFDDSDPSFAPDDATLMSNLLSEHSISRGYTEDPVIVREDGDQFVLFNRMSGGKMIFSVDYPSPPTLKKATFPHLVDISITDYCGYGCEFCYRGSTQAGQHADFRTLKNIVGALASMGTLEIAFGGGEPTAHPQFAELLRLTRQWDIIPNFTSFNIGGWPLDVFSAIKDAHANFAISVDGVEKMVAQQNKVEALRCNGQLAPYAKVSYQYVMGIHRDFSVLRGLLKVLHHDDRLTLLGYKSTERGKSFQQAHYGPEWIEIVKESGGVVAIDTVLASQFEAELLRAGVLSQLFHTKDGVNSMFIDAVKLKVGPSSYQLDDLVPLPDQLWSGLRKMWESL